MLQIKNISKQYQTGDLVQDALRDVNVSLRDNEFVSILGPSGSGKTTLLNIIGGLERYDSGDLIINGISTKKYKDRDWDSYRNHTIGFVFQSYNLIPHQSILSNVELALTIAGISRSERRKRAKKALEEVGLGDQLHKKPNQMSGGQMQRVAIARALVNNPDVLLADEPTGALDTETSIQVMELLKKVAKDKLVVMVTHNPELAEKYSTRIIRLRDGRIIDDSDPYTPAEAAKEPTHKNMGKAKMSFATSLSLSFNNLRTKKGRTLLTSFAGSIGIIGIALILALSTGVNEYISDIQKDTMSSYPITISAETLDMSDVMGMHNEMMRGSNGNSEEKSEILDGVYADNSSLESAEVILSSVTENDLTAFKRYLDDPDSEIQQYLGENGVIYSYDINFDVYAYDNDGVLINTDTDTENVNDSGSSNFASMMGKMSSMQGMPGMMEGTTSSSGAENFSELTVGSNGAVVSQILTDSYDILYGTWPENYDEVVLVLDENNAISTDILYQLGFITADEYKEIVDAIAKGEETLGQRWDYSKICEHSFYLVPASDHYIENEDGTFSHITDTNIETEQLLENAIELRITGIICPAEGAANATISTAVAYTSKLTDYVIDRCNSSNVVSAQQATPETNVLTGMNFEAADNAQKIEDASTYLLSLGISDKATFYQMIAYYSANEATEQQAQVISGADMGGITMDEATMAAALEQWLANSPDEEILVSIYDEYIKGASYEDNMANFGRINYDAPSSISIYTDSFEDKEAIARCIEHYNETVDSDTQITYTDYVALLTSSITSIVNVISYVLIAFVAVSLIVSCIMIGIITHISVLERTKEIGILRALGASKRNISQVFNAETFIIGLCAGLLGIAVSTLLTIPINMLIQVLLGADTLSASLSLTSAVWLVLLSMIITVIGGLLPARKAAKKDPVVALRTE
ncbi:MAG: ABC transporter ATP-binding protein/permease [Eubacteriales bacterium]|nr:ABC transporter ATP-binding protein/permease [Eubacteriales bacterium]